MTAARHLHLVRRPSVIVDLDRGQPMTPPWSREDLDSTPSVPHAVKVGMWLAAWARAERCGLEIIAGRLEPRARFEPSQDLFAALGRSAGTVVGALGFAVPLMFNENRRAFAASWPYCGHGAPMGRS